MARGVKGTGVYSRVRYTGDVHWFFWVIWVIALLVTCALAVGGK